MDVNTLKLEQYQEESHFLAKNLYDLKYSKLI
jgi:hypothetical protein